MADVLYASACFRSFLVTDSPAWPACFWLGEDGGERLYYRLTPAVYAYLADRFRRATAADRDGSLSPERYAAAAARFALVREWADANLDADAVRSAGEGALPAPPIDLWELRQIEAAVHSVSGGAPAPVSRVEEVRESERGRPRERVLWDLTVSHPEDESIDQQRRKFV